MIFMGENMFMSNKNMTIVFIILFSILTQNYAYEKTYNITNINCNTLTSIELQQFIKHCVILSPLNVDNTTKITNNTILIGNPRNNPLVNKYMWCFNLKINNNFPNNTGVIEEHLINGHKVILLSGSDSQGIYASIIMFSNINNIPKVPILCRTSNRIYKCNISLHNNYFKYIVESYLLTPKDIVKVKPLSNKLLAHNKLDTANNIARWVAYNIKYDHNKCKEIEEKKFNWYEYNKPIKTVNTKKGVCLDYATLTSALLLNDNITPYILDMALYNPTSMKISDYHAVVAVKLNNNYYIIDQMPKLIPINEYVSISIDNQKIAKIAMYKIVIDKNHTRLIKEKELSNVAIYGDIINFLNMRYNIFQDET